MKLRPLLSLRYEVGEHPTLAVPVDVDLSAVFAEAGLTIAGATETTLTANAPLADVDARRARAAPWAAAAPRTEAARARLDAIEAAREEAQCSAGRGAFSYPVVTINPMEVRTFLADFA